MQDAQVFRDNSHRWWDPKGPFKALHQLTPHRMRFVVDVCRQVGLVDASKPFKPLLGRKALDIGCGGGLASVPLARLGADVVGLDAEPEAILAAKSHAESLDADIAGRLCFVESDLQSFKGKGGSFDLMVAFEVIEHVDKPLAFMQKAASVLKPGGVFVLSTLARTTESYIKAVCIAESVGWVPKGTHQWQKFINADEMQHMAAFCGLEPLKTKGLLYNPLTGSVAFSDKVSVNYLAAFSKA